MEAELRSYCPANSECSIEKALNILQGKWTFLILRDLFDGTKKVRRAKEIPPWNKPQNLVGKAEGA